MKVIRKNTLTGKQLDNYISDKNTVNLPWLKTTKHNTMKRRVRRGINKMPIIAITLATFGLIFILIGSNTSANIQEETENQLEILLEENPEIEEIIEAEEQAETVNTWSIHKTDADVIEETIIFLKKWEWTHLKAYRDVKRFSICNGTPSYKGEVVTQEVCDQRLRERVQTELLRVNRSWDNLKWNKKVALISFFYNTWYKHNIMQYAARWDDASVVYLMNKYVMAWGKYMKWLQKRRNAEIVFYNK